MSFQSSRPRAIRRRLARLSINLASRGLAATVTLLFCLAAASGSASAGQVPIAAGSRLTLKQAIEIALKRHPLRLEALSEARGAQAEVGVARAELLPQVYGQADYLRSSDNGIGVTQYLNPFGLIPRMPSVPRDRAPDTSQSLLTTNNNFMTGLSVSQFLLDFGKVRGRIEAAQADARAAQASLKLTDLNLIFTVTRRFFGLLAAEQYVKVYQQAIAERELHLKEARAFVRANLKPALDVTIARAQLARAQLHMVLAKDGVADAKVALDNAMGLSGEAPPYRPNGALTYSPITERFPPLLREAFDQRPDLAALEQQARAAGARILEARSDYYPTVRALGGYTTLGTGLPAANNYYVGVAITWPLFSGFATEHQVARARYRRQALTEAIEDLRQQILLQVQTAFLNWQASLEAIHKARQTLDASQVEMHLADERYRSGLGNIIELEDAQIHETADDTAYIAALYGYAVARAAVQRATAKSLAHLGPNNF